MENLFKAWGRKIPRYSDEFKFLFDGLSQKFGAEGERKIALGKHFSTNYELYTFAFFLGLYEDEFVPIPKERKKRDFSHHIEFWGSKSNVSTRKDFTNLQEYIFAALIARTQDLDLLGLEKGEIDVEEILKKLIFIMEAYTNGGLNLIKEKLEENENYFLKPTAFLDLLLFHDEYETK